jgi:flavin-binding protein dodecin
MTVAKIVEISSSSTKSFEDAIRTGLERTSKTVDEIRSAWIKDQEVIFESGRVTEYRVHMKVTFVLKE